MSYFLYNYSLPTLLARLKFFILRYQPEVIVMTLEQLRAQREALQAARLSGVFQIKAGDKWITYRSDKEIQAALADVDREIARMEGRPRPRRIRAYCSKGL